MADLIAEDGDGFMTTLEAGKRLGVSKTRMSRLIGARRLQPFQRGLDKRVKWLRCEDVERLAAELRVMTPDQRPARRAKKHA